MFAPFRRLSYDCIIPRLALTSDHLFQSPVMHCNTLARRASSFSRRPTSSFKLHVESLEERSVPAHNLTIVAGSTDSNILIGPGNGSTITIFTKGDSAQLSIGTLQSQLQDTNTLNLIVTTDVKNGQPGNQAGTIIWDAGTAGNLDFSGFGSGKTLEFRTVTGAGAVGNITLTSVQFNNGGTNDQISLKFDTSDVNGNLLFQSSGGANPTVGFTGNSVADLTVQTGTGAFNFTDSGNSTDGNLEGSLLISTGALTLNHTSGIDAGGTISLTAGGAFSLGSNTQLSSFGDFSATANGAFASTGGQFNSQAGSISISGTSVTLNNVSLEAGQDIAINGPLTVMGAVIILASGPITISGSVNGAADLTLSAEGSITTGGPIGSGIGLNSLSLLQGSMSATTLSSAQVTVGELANPVSASLGLSGALTGNLLVRATGSLAPAGIGPAGTLLVTGNVDFIDGDLAIDFGAGTADQLIVTGNVSISGFCQLGGGLGTGQLTSGSATLIDCNGTLSGEFTNAPVGTPVLVGTDAISVLTYTPDLIVVPFMPVAGSTATGFDPNDGTGFKATITGGGQVLTGTDWNGEAFMIVRNSTAVSKLTVTTKANASDDIVSFPAGVLVSGPLASFSAAKVDIGNEFRASGFVASATFRDFLAGAPTDEIQFGGLASQFTTIRARNIFGSVQTGSTLSSLKVALTLGLPSSTVSAPAIGSVSATTASTDITSGGRVASVKILGSYNGLIDADSLGKFTVGGGSATLNTNGAIDSIVGKGEAGLALDLSASKVGPIKVDARLTGVVLGVGSDWAVTEGIASLAVGAISDLTVNAKYLGAVNVKGNPKFGLSGDITDSKFTMTGNDGTTAKNGLKSLVAKGNVIDSRFDVRAGNVGAVTVGRFHDSQLWLGYTAAGNFTTGTIAAGFKLASFNTTALATTDPNFSLNWAFKGSEIVADSIGTVTLSGLQTANAGVGFGIKIKKAGATVLVTKADVTNDPDLSLGTNLIPDKTVPFTALTGDFFYIQA